MSGPPRAHAGFSLLEALVAVAVLMAVFAGTFSLLAPSEGLFRLQPEVAAVHQRVRVAADALATDLRGAGAGPSAGPLAGALTAVVPPVSPVPARDGAGGAAAREDAVSVVVVPPAGAVAVTAAAHPAGTSALTLGPAPCQPVPATVCGFRAGDRLLVAGGGRAALGRVAGVQPPDVLVVDAALAPGFGPGATVVAVRERTYRLRPGGEAALVRADDGGPAFPLVDHVVGLRVEYFGAAGALPLASLNDGPWAPSSPAPWRHDVDLWRVRRVRVTLRAEAPAAFRGPAGPRFLRAGVATRPSSWVPDREIVFDVSLRNVEPWP